MSGPCADCTCGRAERLDADPVRLGQARSFTAPAEGPSAAEGIEPAVPLRSKAWWNDPEDDMCGAYVERYLNGGLTMGEITSRKKPIIGIAQTGSDLAPCNSHHVQLAKRVRDGIIAAGGTPIEFPCHPIQETSKRPTASLDRNLAYLSLVEVLYGYPLDGVVLLTGCDKTTPALLMAAATVNIPAIAMNVGPMLNGYLGQRLVGSGTVLWDARAAMAAGKIDQAQMIREVATSAPSLGHCNTMGTASTMNALAEALGMALPGSASIPAVYRERGACAYETGRRIVDLVLHDVKPSDIMTREAFENAIACCTAIGGSTNAPIHLNAIAKHIGVELTCADWERVGYSLPLLVNVQPAGIYLCEEYHRAGGLPAVIAELLEAELLPHPSALTVSGKSIGDNCRGDFPNDPRVIRPVSRPVVTQAGFLNLTGNLFDSAIMKTSVISPAFHEQYLSNPDDPMAFEGPIAVFDGPEDYHHRIETDKNIAAGTILIMRGAGPLGYPGAAEVVNMIPPGRLIKQGIELPCIGDGRQSGTSGSPSILNASPEAAVGGNLAYLKDGDVVRIDLNLRRAEVRLTADELLKRRDEMGAYKMPVNQTPWQELFRKDVGQLSEGMVLQSAVKYQKLAQTQGIPRRNH
ncbi:dihydroxy-acid/6-phosphogluconate dehydratase [Kockovaella imperatae]|uniref:Dihydroxy-acid/6-phosphogluconate dehydratase n=1 Tax=Kockovaella imperatae TaxID=4999 RepID=A0A1Y1U8E2_9TREE|nr:dihydroxy-acid/6-phosphogluconate dehydratase [Kockovaella imperatae]ORX34310.1 dihydroxy-acid/6-phosphogluconate dehydratase [Kockovaella imperatae]